MNTELRNYFVKHFAGAHEWQLPTGSHYMEGWLEDGARYLVSQNCVNQTVVVTRDEHYLSAGGVQEALEALRHFTEGRAAAFRVNELTRFVAMVAQKPVYNNSEK